MADWLAWLEPFGADRQALHLFDTDGPELLPYSTLTNARRDSGSILEALGAVYEWQDAPLVFLVDADQIDDVAQIHQLRRLLAMRGDAPYLGIAAPGRLARIATANGRRTGGAGSRAIGIRDRAAESTLRPFGGRRTVARRTMAMAAAILAIIVAAISS